MASATPTSLKVVDCWCWSCCVPTLFPLPVILKAVVDVVLLSCIQCIVSVVVFHDFEVYTNVGESKLSFKTSLSLAMARWWWAGLRFSSEKQGQSTVLARERGRGERAVIFYFCLFLPKFSYFFHFFYFYIFTFNISLVKTRPVWRREGEGEAVASQLAHGSSMASELMT